MKVGVEHADRFSPSQRHLPPGPCFVELRLGRSAHRYSRVGPDAYGYRAPIFGYTAMLEVSDVGFVTKYPGLWELDALH